MRKILLILGLFIAFNVNAQFKTIVSTIQVNDSATSAFTGGEIWFDEPYFFGYDGTNRDTLNGSGSGGGGSGISDASSDTNIYVRTDAGWDDISTVNSQYLSKNEQWNLVHWKAGLINAHYDKSASFSTYFLGDSYGFHYGGKFKDLATKIYGFGGGYENFIGTKSYSTTGYEYIGSASWVWNIYDAQTSLRKYNLHNRYAYSITNGATINIAQRQFNKIRIHYLKGSGYGGFTVQLGSTGTPSGITSTAGTGDGWYYEDFGDTILYHPRDTIIIKTSSTDTVKMLGHFFEYVEYDSDKIQPLIVHIVQDGGAEINRFYSGKDAPTMTTYLDTLGIDLFNIFSLDENDGNIIDYYSILIDSLKQWEYYKDIAILSAHDDKNGRFANDELKLFQKIADNKDVAFFNMYNYIGDMDSLVSAGFSTDSIHLAGDGDYLIPFVLMDWLLPKTSSYDDFATNNLQLDGTKGILIPNTTNVSITADGVDPSMYGTDNVFFGVDAGLNNTSGSYNQFIGRYTGKTNTTGGSNIAIGLTALTANVDGDNNVALGSESLASNISGDDNIAIGRLALRVNTTSSNTAIGTQSLYSQTTGILNTAIGFKSMFDNQTGGSNVAVGYSALYNNISGSFNVAIGRDALFGANGASSYNIAIGRRTLNGTGAKSNNVAVGFQAGEGITTGSGNVLIGYDVGSNLTTESNQLYLDNTDTSTPLIYGDMLTDDVKINGDFQLTTKTPSSASDTGIAGTICWDASYIYICTATNTWKRVAISTW